MDYYSAFPFYMGYQGYGQWAQPGIVSEDRILEDLEYLQQMYPTYARKYQNTISSVVDKMDYDGSFIYDQYPDKLTIQRMVESVVAIIRTNEKPMDTEAGIPVQNSTIPDAAAHTKYGGNVRAAFAGAECHGEQHDRTRAHRTGSMAGEGAVDQGTCHRVDVL